MRMPAVAVRAPGDRARVLLEPGRELVVVKRTLTGSLPAASQPPASQPVAHDTPLRCDLLPPGVRDGHGTWSLSPRLVTSAAAPKPPSLRHQAPGTPPFGKHLPRSPSLFKVCQLRLLEGAQDLCGIRCSPVRDRRNHRGPAADSQVGPSSTTQSMRLSITTASAAATCARSLPPASPCLPRCCVSWYAQLAMPTGSVSWSMVGECAQHSKPERTGRPWGLAAARTSSDCKPP